MFSGRLGVVDGRLANFVLARAAVKKRGRISYGIGDRSPGAGVPTASQHKASDSLVAAVRKARAEELTRLVLFLDTV